MAGHARYTALLDACVLYKIAVCDALMSLAVRGLYAAKWTARINDEWMQALEENLSKPPGAFLPRRDAMRDAIPDWEVPGVAWKALQPCLTLPRDPNDVHVLAAAIAGHADCIVTENLKDFPAAQLAQFGLEAIHPDEFLIAQIDLDPVEAYAAFKDQRKRLKKGNYTPEAFADAFERNGLVRTAQRLRDVADLL